MILIAWGFAAIVVLWGVLFPWPFSPVREKPRPVYCVSNEKQILLAITMYADNSGGRCPMDSTNPTLLGSMKLLSNVVTTAIVFHCPDDHRPGARAEADFRKLTTLNISYSYVPNLKWRDTPDSPVILDRIYSTANGSPWPATGNHGDKGGNVGFIDGHVQWCNALPAALKDKDGKQVVLSP
jgi:prepilin-type processing-associated H-X9-DG protein